MSEPEHPKEMAQRTPEELAELLRSIANIVQSGDSFEGTLSWTFGTTPGTLSVAMTIRTGNLQGQGSVCVL